jgi:hypothetical protein
MKTFIEQRPNGRWVYGFTRPKSWWKFWAKDKRSFYSAFTRKDAEEGLKELCDLYAKLGFPLK